MKAQEQPRARVELGDWQTPPVLAKDVLTVLAATTPVPASVLEPTCGDGAFLRAAADRFPHAQLRGFDISAAHVAVARNALSHTNATITCADFFAVDWNHVFRELPEPILVIGNPPWVTSAAVGALGGSNLPAKTNFKRDRGMDARTGKGNFDISEWMLLRLLQGLSGRRFTMAMLCKTRVARQLLLQAGGAGVTATLYELDTRAHFAATVDAVLLVLQTNPAAASVWPVYSSLFANQPARTWGLVNGQLVNDVSTANDTAYLEGSSDLAWRSGLKHDCAAVMEWTRHADVWQNGVGETASLWEEGHLYPLGKGRDVAAGRAPVHRVIVTQTRLADDTRGLQTAAPNTWAYLQRHKEKLDGRKSRIYSGQPPFAMFGVGGYAFAPYKVAICGLYKRLRFHVFGPHEGRPVMFDDTCYFLPCASQAQAEALACALNSNLAQRFFNARVFWDSKRPVTKTLLATLSLPRLLAAA